MALTPWYMQSVMGNLVGSQSFCFSRGVSTDFLSAVRVLALNSELIFLSCSQVVIREKHKCVTA